MTSKNYVDPTYAPASAYSAAYNEWGNIDCMLPPFMAEVYNDLTRRIVEIRQYGPHSTMNGGPDTPYEVKWQRYQERQNEEGERRRQLYEWALETGQWDYRPDDVPWWAAAHFSPGGKRPKGWHLSGDRRCIW